MAALREISTYRFAFGFAVAPALILVWMMLGVGFVGDEGDLADLMYAGVVAVAIIGTIVARLQPEGMSKAMFVTAAAQGIVTVIALVSGRPQAGGTPVEAFLATNVFFVAMWASSAWLFRSAARERSDQKR